MSSRVLCVEVLEMEARVTSMEGWPGARGPGKAAAAAVEVEDEDGAAEMVLPRASVVVRSHCFASTALGRMGGEETLPPE